jgi:hypothetical protein
MQNRHKGVSMGIQASLIACTFRSTSICEAFVLWHVAPCKTVTDWELGVSVTTIAIPFVVFLLVDKASPRDSGTLACNPG